MRLLLVDDESIPLEDMRLSLEPAGFEIDTTTQPLKALEMYRERPYDAVISDVRMPGMDGITLLKELRGLDITARVIIVTAYGDVETAKAAVNNRAFAFFGKPVSFPELIRTLRDIEREQNRQSEQNSADVERLRKENARLKQVYDDLLNEIRTVREEQD